MLTVPEIKEYLHIDFDDPATDQTLQSLDAAAEQYLVGSLGQNFPRDDPRARQLALLIISDLYDNRGLNSENAKLSNTVRHLVHSMSLQLRLEGSEYAGGNL